MAKPKIVKPIKLVFKTSKKPSGLARIGSGYYIEVKMKGKKIGVISGGSVSRSECVIQLAIKKPSSTTCPWSWVFIENNCKNEEEAKTFVEGMIDDFAQNNELYQME